MRGLTLDGVGVITHRTDLPEPAVEQPSDAIVAVHRAGLCGSDLHAYQGRERVRLGVIPGHEVVGEVVEAGGDVADIAVGDRVLVPFTTNCGVCDSCATGLSSRCAGGGLFGYGDPDRPDLPALSGGQAELVRVPLAESTLVRIPQLISDEEAVLLADNYPTGWHAAQQARIVPGQPAAIFGLGSVGLCAVVAALEMGAEPVTAFDPLVDRQERAARLGARIASVEEASGSFISVVEAAGTSTAQGLAFRSLRPGGTLSVISVPTSKHFGMTPIEAYDRNATISSGRAPVRSILDQIWPRVIGGDLAIPAEVILTHPRVPLDQGPEMYRRFAEREPGVLKAAFMP